VVISLARTSDASLIHELMITAFMEYKNEIPPSSVLEESVLSVSEAIHKGEKALIAFEDNKPIGMVRFQFLSSISYSRETRTRDCKKDIKIFRGLCK